jgi:TonB family protein
MTGTASRRPYELGRVTADLVVLTVLPEEYEAVLGCLAAPDLLLGSEGAPNTYAWQLGALDAPRYGATFRVVVGMGTPTTMYGALAAMQAIRLFDPRYIAFVGVAGGFVRDGQRHGDVAVSSAVVAYEYGKVDTGGFAPRGDFTYRCDSGLVRAAEAAASTQWWREDETTRPPRVRTGMIASGDKLIDDPEEAFFATVAKMWPKLLAVEMEGAGVGAAAHEAQSQGHRAGFVLVRGISDMPHTKAGEDASTGERDSWKRTAARNAARFLAHMVAEAWPERPRGEVRASSDGEREPPGETEPAAVVASGSVAEGAGPAVGGVMVSPVTGHAAPARWEPAHASEETRVLSQRLQDAYGRRKRLLDAGAATDAVDREILERKRQLREGGRLRAGDSLGEGRYVLVEELGRGGFAVVWKAKDEVEERHVAIKVLHANLAGDAIRRQRFYRGARAMRGLQHAGVVRVLDPEGEDGGFCYFVMEMVLNGNLHDAVVGKRVPGGAGLGHILRVGEALAEAHSQGMIHRDIKPQNILLDEVFEAKLTDFDLVGTKDSTGGTRTGAMGTVIYAAPECLEKPQAATERADVYGLGMTALFCLAGKALTLSTLRNAEPTITGLDCSPAVKEVLRRAVSWEAEARYADAGAMVSALRVAMSTDLGAKVVNGDAEAEAGSAVPSGVVSATPGGGSQPREPARSARGTSRADHTQNPPWVAGRSMDDLPVFGGGGFSELPVIVPIQSRPNNNKLMYALIGKSMAILRYQLGKPKLIGSVSLLAVAAVVVVVLLKSNSGSGGDKSGAQVASAMDRAGATPDKEPGAAAGTPAEAKPADTAAEPNPSDSKPPEPRPVESRDVKPAASTPPPERALAALPPPRKTAAATNLAPAPSKTPKPPDKAAPAPPWEPAVPKETKETGGGCDEFACILTYYEGTCCAKFKKGGSKAALSGGGDRPAAAKGDVPESLERATMSEGINKVKSKVMSCGEKSSAKGTVRVSVKVAPEGHVTSVTVKSSLDPGIDSCVSGAVQKATFAKTKTGGSFSYPFTF